MLTCKHATRVMSQSQERPLTLRERLSLRLHLMMCSGCRNYQKQINFIRSAMRRLGG